MTSFAEGFCFAVVVGVAVAVVVLMRILIPVGKLFVLGRVSMVMKMLVLVVARVFASLAVKKKWLVLLLVCSWALNEKVA